MPTSARLFDAGPSGAVLAALLVAAAPLAAQPAERVDAQCANPAMVGSRLEGGDACQKALDLLRYLNPQLGMLIAGGNATLGQGGTLGGLGHFALTLRVNATRQLGTPQLDENDINVGPAVRTAYAVDEMVGGFPVADLALGLYKGFPVHGRHVGGVDALVNVFYVPASLFEQLQSDDFSVVLPEGGLKLGYGVRIGVLGETRRLPGISLTYIRRSLPTISASTTTLAHDANGQAYGDTISLEALSVRTTAWRLVAGKKLWIFAVAAGAGQDRYRTTGGLTYAVHDENTGAQARGTLRAAQSLARTNVFADLSLNLFLFKVVGEVGRVSGGEIATYNGFSQDAGRARTYGAVGMRFGR